MDWKNRGAMYHLGLRHGAGVAVHLSDCDPKEQKMEKDWLHLDSIFRENLLNDK